MSCRRFRQVFPGKHLFLVTVGQHANRSANAQQLRSGHNYLAVWIPTTSLATTRVLPGGFGVIDLIGTDPPLYRRVIQWITGQ
ncbi:hypothetical protein [Sphingomonas sp.]|uniref:hypothetical protein n=1 Tax=Sphingomonas sp. TaxID=28214 RepID=UPI002D7F2091|nr:hypothetical protein [Sphingomonas sp.]HEU0044687.1 hypothetical protein [Sphingomonas sp.]